MRYDLAIEGGTLVSGTGLEKQNQSRACSSRPQVVGCNPFDFRLAIFYQH